MGMGFRGYTSKDMEHAARVNTLDEGNLAAPYGTPALGLTALSGTYKSGFYGSRSSPRLMLSFLMYSGRCISGGAAAMR